MGVISFDTFPYCDHHNHYDHYNDGQGHIATRHFSIASPISSMEERSEVASMVIFIIFMIVNIIIYVIVIIHLILIMIVDIIIIIILIMIVDIIIKILMIVDILTKNYLTGLSSSPTILQCKINSSPLSGSCLKQSSSSSSSSSS